MASSDAVLKKIDEAIVREELAVPIYTSHISAALFWSGVSDAKKKTIIQDLKLLTRESKAHIALLKKVRRYYLSSKHKHVHQA